MRRIRTKEQFLFRLTALLVVLSIFPVTDVGLAAAPSDPPRQREFQFTYEASLNGLSPGQAVRVWLPVASTSSDSASRSSPKASCRRIVQLRADVRQSHLLLRNESRGRWDRLRQRFGNCSDFHSLFLSLARSQRIPAKFEIGFPLPEKRSKGEITGYHCWAKFSPAGGPWVPVDISEARKHPDLRDYYFGHLTSDRICLSTSRDMKWVPIQQGPPINFFIYPYAETGGKPLPSEKVGCKCTFEDLGKRATNGTNEHE